MILATSLESNRALGTSQSLRSGEQKILGVHWNVSADHLVIDVSNVAHLAKELEPTKRHIVSIVGRFYEPLGFMSPVVIQFKILFQELCRAKLDWDEPLDGELLRKWRSLISDLQGSPTVSIPRHFLNGICTEIKSYSLHGFCDASKDAYAAVLYLLFETTTGLHVRFVASKTGACSPCSRANYSQIGTVVSWCMSPLVQGSWGREALLHPCRFSPAADLS